MDRPTEDWPSEVITIVAMPVGIERNIAVTALLTRDDFLNAIKRFMRRFKRDSDDLEDLVADCKVKLLEVLRKQSSRDLRFPYPSSSAAWIQRICANLILSKMKANKDAIEACATRVSLELPDGLELNFDDLAKDYFATNEKPAFSMDPFLALRRRENTEVITSGVRMLNEEFFVFCMDHIDDERRTGRRPFAGWRPVLVAFLNDLYTRRHLLAVLIPPGPNQNRIYRDARKRLQTAFKILSKNAQFEFCKDRLTTLFSEWCESGAKPRTKLKEIGNEHLE